MGRICTLGFIKYPKKRKRWHIPYKVIIIQKQGKIFLPRSMLDGKINYFWASPCCLLCLPALQKQVDLHIWHNHFKTEKIVSCLNRDNFSSVWKLFSWAIHFLSPFCLLLFSFIPSPIPFFFHENFAKHLTTFTFL